MTALALNDVPEVNSGLLSMWAFAGSTLRFMYDNNETEFVDDALKTARSLPTSFYGVALNGRSWELEGEMRLTGGDDPWIATQVMRTVSSDGRMRRWQWELRRHRSANRGGTAPPAGEAQTAWLAKLDAPAWGPPMVPTTVAPAAPPPHAPPSTWFVESIGSSDRLGNFDVDG